MLTKRRHRFRPLRKLLHVTIGLLLLALIGVGYQIVGMVQDRKLYLNCTSTAPAKAARP